jgi:hypothetical protein
MSIYRKGRNINILFTMLFIVPPGLMEWLAKAHRLCSLLILVIRIE